MIISTWLNNLKIRKKIKWLQNNCKYFGENIRITPNLRIFNPQYISLGANSYFGPGCRIEAWDSYNKKKFNPQIILGKDIRINSRCHIGAINKVTIGDNCLIGSNVMIIDHAHGDNSPKELLLHPGDRDLYSKGPISIGERTWLCENVVVLPNVHIGKGCVIGANAVVTKDIPDYSVAVGNPARVVKQVNIEKFG